MTNSEAILTVERLTKRFGALLVSDQINLTVQQGQIHAVIGPNGAGKTTLIRQLSGEILPDAGRIFIAQRDVTHTSVQARAHLGMARSFQITNVLRSFTVLENVALAVQARAGHSFRFWRNAAKEAQLNQRALDVLETVGLVEQATQKAGKLSHGQQRLLEIAMALAMQPKVLLLDEPMAGVGPEESNNIVALLKLLRDSYAMILIEHDMDAVFALADQITVLVYGRVIASGSPEMIRHHPDVQAAYLGNDISNDLPSAVNA
ncbi:ABC transporter ATP-binding protein [Oscillatoria sp. FACHB-1407]|uniref:ABC transporter ATP-binding protein n=1 Tax=Oscillatoria sp. FACHB-1407 TaxID=2692847 RepID=UPI001685E9A8|nr:ABC transporter ATP-binding protein [Oscillatoria sp. FACHB-1407]MBD2465757.1 ABC transporter ATP-binding protein [Oscillatoria sp. FACHB-1407]